jgi:mersacidin/lichenicidin family type 2 lantibiotic
MSKQQIIRAWKDQTYRRGLSEAERALLPANPAGRVELDAITAAELAGINGGRGFYSTNDPTACYVSTADPAAC